MTDAEVRSLEMKLSSEDSACLVALDALAPKPLDALFIVLKPDATLANFSGSLPSDSLIASQAARKDDMSIFSSDAASSGSFLSAFTVLPRLDLGRALSSASEVYRLWNLVASKLTWFISATDAAIFLIWLAMLEDSLSPLSERTELTVSRTWAELFIWEVADAIAETFFATVDEIFTPCSCRTASAIAATFLLSTRADDSLEMPSATLDSDVPTPRVPVLSSFTSSARPLTALRALSALDSIEIRSWSMLASATATPFLGAQSRRAYTRQAHVP